MKSNQKNFNMYVFLSTFARNLLETFIPIILYKSGYALKEVVFYYLLVNIFSLVITYLCFKKLDKINYKIFSLIGIFAFGIMQILLNTISHSLLYIIIISFLFALYRRGYWISRRYYSLNVISEKNISISYTIITIINQLGVIFSAYIGSLLLDFLSIKVLTIISILLFAISIIPLHFINVKDRGTGNLVDLKNTMKRIGAKKLYIFGTYESLNVVKFLFSLYLIIYVKDTYQTVGFVNLFTNIATLIFAYIYGKIINENKNFLKLSIVFVVITYIFKANTTSYLLILISFLEGLFIKMYEISINKEFYALSKEFEYENYNFVYELVQNILRSTIVLILFFFNNVRLMIYITLFFILIGVFINVKLNSKYT